MSQLKQFLKVRIKPYSFLDIKKPKPYIISYFDENDINGIADRLRHSLSLYLFCKENNREFKIWHNFPFCLEDILTPVYNWTMPSNEISNSFYFTKRIEIWSTYKSSQLTKEEEETYQYGMLTRQSKTNHQYKVVGNMHYKECEWKNAFDELFRPSPIVLNGLKSINLPESYDAITLRFQQLLGDFKEGQFKILDKNQQDKLIKLSINKITELYEQGYFKTKMILVTSDSSKFISAISKIPYIITIPGAVAHPGYSNYKNIAIYAKSFIDLYALRGASTITLLKSEDMYLSGFPEFASKIGNNKFNVVYY